MSEEDVSNTSLKYALDAIRREAVNACIHAIESCMPRNEPGEYWRGRFDAADLCREVRDRTAPIQPPEGE